MTDISIQNATYSKLDIDSLLSPWGGMAVFIQPGDKVLLKPNLLSGRKPEKAVTTHPEVVRAVARAVKRVGGVPYIGDSPSNRFSKGVLRKAYQGSGLQAVADEEGVALNWDTGSQRQVLPDAVALKQTSFCNFALEADKIIALPKLKTHSLQYLTLACKIMYGAIPGLTKARYHAQFPRRHRFADMLLDVTLFLKPTLYILDGIVGMQGQGPGSGDPLELGWLVAATDPLAMDLAVCRLIDVEPVAIPVLKRAKVRKLWPAEMRFPLLDPEKIACTGFRLPTTSDHLLTGKKSPPKKPQVSSACVACGECVAICPKDAITMVNGRAWVKDAKCIRCYCCHEVCPERAIDLVPIQSK
ncbi:MAG: DUF362 domain-containing protein [Desulfobacterales bacterium]